MGKWVLSVPWVNQVRLALTALPALLVRLVKWVLRVKMVPWVAKVSRVLRDLLVLRV